MSRRRRGRLLDGLFLLDKPVGMSSNHALQRARRLYDARKAGHTGTLDPFATGLLICCFGRATKLSAALLEADKNYIATLRWGAETTTADLDGEVTVRAEMPFAITAAQVDAVLPQFIGTIEQMPPMYSALKKDGRPLYEYARQGVEVERAARYVQIYGLKRLCHTAQSLTLEVRCSKGTYVRTLAQDIGRALGCYAHLTALRRTQIGPFNIDAAHSLRSLQTAIAEKSTVDIDQWLLTGKDLPAELLPVNF
ncbi:MAG TPA: tRNA pseudouridine(55) synthase TruB [Paenalcaligenes sp.]|nr:tRNA pseudouridine(55) synthase TruB [Paenalcaligenes sp.]